LKFFIIFFSVLVFSGCSPEIPESIKELLKEEEKRELISKGLSPKAFFDEAMKQLNEGARDEGIILLKQLQAAYPSSKYSIQAKIEIIYSHYKSSKFEDAIEHSNDFIKLYPNHFSTPYAYYLRGLSAESKSRSILDDFITDNAQRDVSSVIDAFNYYLALIKKFPETEYSEEAKKRLVIIRNIIARHELFVAIFYTKKQAHIAAINRCNHIIERYPNTPSIPAALHLLNYNYKKIGATDLAEDTKRVLLLNYPKYKPHYSLED